MQRRIAVVFCALLWPAGLAGPALAVAGAQAPLSPEQAVKRAAAANPSLRAALADAAAARQSVRAERAARGPTLFAHADGQYAENLIATGQGVGRTDARSLGTGVSLRYTTESGTALEAGATGDLSWRSANITPSTSTTLELGPNPGATLQLQVRQPLLRGAGRDVTLAALRQARAGQRQAERARDDAASGLVRDVLVAYWELWYAERALSVQHAALEVALQQHRDAQVRTEQLGTAPATELLRFASELSSVRDTMAEAQATRQTRALELGRLLALDFTAPPAAARALEPPETSPPPPLPRLIAQARASSSELRALAQSVQTQRERVRAALDADQARLDLTATAAASGLWTDDDLSGLALPDDRPGWSTTLGVELELPVGDSPAAARRAQAQAQLVAATARYRARAQAIEAEVATLRSRLEVLRERVSLLRAMAEDAAKLAVAERRRLQLGTATSIEVVQAQQSARDAQLRRLRAEVDRAQAALELDHRVGALLVRYAAALGEVTR